MVWKAHLYSTFHFRMNTKKQLYLQNSKYISHTSVVIILNLISRALPAVPCINPVLMHHVYLNTVHVFKAQWNYTTVKDKFSSSQLKECTLSLCFLCSLNLWGALLHKDFSGQQLNKHWRYITSPPCFCGGGGDFRSLDLKIPRV